MNAALVNEAHKWLAPVTREMFPTFNTVYVHGCEQKVMS